MPQVEWSERERWVWEQVRAGKIANFNDRLGNKLDPRFGQGWDEYRLKAYAFASGKINIL